MNENDPKRRDRFREGLRDGRWEVRRASALGLMPCAEPSDLPALAALLHDPKVQVRHAVVVAIAVAFGPAREAEVIPLLVERALADESLRVRRQAVSMLAWQLAHPDLEGFFAQLVATETDAKLVRFARAGRHLARLRAARAQEPAPC
jgi:HEAT repeat protein